MCGVWGYRAAAHTMGWDMPGVCARPNVEMLWAAAEGASRRGPHGVGWAWMSPNDRLFGGLQVTRAPGPLGPHRPSLARLEAPLIVGHARLATMGDYSDVRELQPCMVGEVIHDPPQQQLHAVVHNGVITNADELHPGARTDSWALALAYASLRITGESPQSALETLIGKAVQVSWAVLVLDHTGVLVAHRRRHPLYVLDLPHGAYVSSHRFHPDAEPVPEDQAVVI